VLVAEGVVLGEETFSGVPEQIGWGEVPPLRGDPAASRTRRSGCGRRSGGGGHNEAH
jgi:hypothetical protein